MLSFNIHLQSDQGLVRFEIEATSKTAAIRGVIKMENAPLNAVKKANLIVSRMTVKECEFYHLDYFNNWLRLESFADYYGLTKKEAKRLIDKGRL